MQFIPVQIPAIILAAGKSERFGAPKVLQTFAGQPFLLRIVKSLRSAGIDTILLILGHNAEKIISALPEAGQINILMNKQYEMGQFSSLQLGIANLPPDSSGCLLCLIDQPFLRSDTVGQLRQTGENERDKIIIPIHQNRGGHPVYLPRNLFEPITGESSSHSLRDVLQKNQNLIIRRKVADPLIVEDIDTVADLKRLAERFNPNNS
ncbi:MAG TPA: nucleotidyltransferase family protein [Bacteroidetes bacterium]|nr:nucleotidyltransferase family protein [Bacteroidota bacterium]